MKETMDDITTSTISIEEKGEEFESGQTKMDEEEHEVVIAAATPLHKGALSAIITIYMVEGFVFSFIFPFMGFMILDFGLVKETKDAGYYSGILAGSFAVAQFFAGFVYGSLADKVSKKRIILLSIVGCGITVIGFGFCQNKVPYGYEQ